MSRFNSVIAFVVGHAAKLILVSATCSAVTACSSSIFNSGTASPVTEENPWVETRVLKGYVWNGTYEGISRETEIIYDVEDGNIAGLYREDRGYETEHCYADDFPTYCRYWEKNDQGDYTKGEFGYVENDGSHTVETEYEYSYEYDNEGTITKDIITAKELGDSNRTTVIETEYGENGQFRSVSVTYENGKQSMPTVRSSEDNRESIKYNTHGDKLYYKADDSGDYYLSFIEICDNSGRVLYRIEEGGNPIGRLPSDFDTELGDISNCCITGYAYDEHDNVVEQVGWDNETTTIRHNCYSDDNYLIYDTLYLETSNDNQADISTHQYVNYKTGEKTELIHPRDVEVQRLPILVEPLSDYLSHR